MRTYKYFDNVKKNAVFTEQACQFCGSKNDCLEVEHIGINNNLRKIILNQCVLSVWRNQKQVFIFQMKYNQKL